MIPANHDPDGAAKRGGIWGAMNWLDRLDGLSVVVDPELDEIGDGSIIICGWRDGQVCYTHTIAADGGMADDLP